METTRFNVLDYITMLWTRFMIGYHSLVDQFNIPEKAVSVANAAYRTWERSDQNWRENEIKKLWQNWLAFYRDYGSYSRFCEIFWEIINLNSDYLQVLKLPSPECIVLPNYYGKKLGIMSWRIKLLKSSGFDLNPQVLTKRLEEVICIFLNTFHPTLSEADILVMNRMIVLSVDFSSDIIYLNFACLEDPFTQNTLAKQKQSRSNC
ncbi:MAG: hypothetical protein RR685_08405 [Hungatella sp.]